MDAADRQKLFGTAEPLPEIYRLRAGTLEAELIGGNLRAVRFAGHEVLRTVAYVVRDRDWGTYAPAVEIVSLEETEFDFTVRTRSVCRATDGSELHAEAEITGDASGRLTFTVTAEPRGDFETNRCGFCVLHPIDGVAGQPVEVTHTDGTVEQACFPDLIAPWQPFKDIRALRHEIAPGVFATCHLEGDAFEMEDQRAWSDASFKTYVRPLALPWPYVLPAGQPFTQSVTLSLAGDVAGLETRAIAPASASPVRVQLTLGENLGEAMPAIGVVIAAEDARAILAYPATLHDLAPQSLLFSYDPLAGDGVDDLQRFAAIAALQPSARAVLECILPARDGVRAEVSAAAAAVERAGLRLDAVTVGPAVDRQSTPPGSPWPACPPLAEIYAEARNAFPGVRLGGGMFSFFTELNRKRPPVALLDYVTHATCPIVHAADDRSVMETLEAIPFITRSTRAIIGKAPYHLGPTTIGMRQNPYGSRTMPNPDGRRIAMAGDDSRQRGLFGAAWLVGYAARLAGAGIETWTAGALAGPRGQWLDTEKPEAGVVPAFHVLRGMAQLAGCRRIAFASSDASRVDGFAAVTWHGETVLWIANLGPEETVVALPEGGWRGFVLGLSDLDAAAAGRLLDEADRASPLTLPAYGVARLTGLA
ncbi:D-apionate lactonase [Aureimonas glaciei]|uniref:Uncharacterized protein n=1 Tax=Aureimonas glaciei TaxID=1776957 RepID=A0A917DBR4_9HYPH|nr:hypothetical protein [Aureimonas glaciei]GGD23070.1 hypothetical protein GCM10011335_27470 [Aureimonas glaciei]